MRPLNFYRHHHRSQTRVVLFFTNKHVYHIMVAMDMDLNSTANHNEEKERLEEWRRKRAKRRQEATETSNTPLHQYADNEDADDGRIEIATDRLTAAKRRRLELEALGLRQENHADPDQQKQLSTVTRTNENNKTDEHDADADDSQQPEEDATRVESLLEQAAALQKDMTAADRELQQRRDEEQRILREASKVQTNALQAASEIASGLTYSTPMPSSWTVPRWMMRQQSESADVDVWAAIRKEWHMDVQGDDVPPPMKRFVDMKLPPPILKYLQEKKIQRPTPIQMQGLPVALAGRDMVGIAFTGSGKTLAFGLPLVMAALEEELRMPLLPGEGPVGVIMAPSRELARQTFDLIVELAGALRQPTAGSESTSAAGGPYYPEIRAQLMIGGESAREQLQVVQEQGVHCIVATPGRLRDVLKRRAINLMICRYICLDEADRMLDMGFDEEVGEIMNYFPHQRQTLLFSATFPKKFQDFARQTLVQPIVVNVGRAGGKLKQEELIEKSMNLGLTLRSVYRQNQRPIST
jgi:ATP-dependent RNA helicase DDX41